MEWVSLFGIVLSIALFALLCFRGIPVIVSAPLLSILVWLFGLLGGQRLTFDEAIALFASGAGTAVEKYLLLFMLSALFGSLIREVGIASAMGDLFGRWILHAPKGCQKLLAVGVVPLINAILTYSEVSVFVVVFAVVAIARDLFRRMDIPWHLYAMSMVGSATFTAGLLPGSPSLSNLVQIEYLGTTPVAAPVLSLTLSTVSGVLGLGYMAFALWRTERAGEGFLPTGEGISKVDFGAEGGHQPINVWLAFLPVLSPVLFINVFQFSVNLSLLLSDLLILVLYARHLSLERFRGGMISGMTAGVSPAVSLGVMMGFGNMLINSPGFQPVLTLTEHAPGPPFVRVILLVAITSFLLGNANAGITASLGALGEEFLFTCGTPPEVLHRLAGMASTFGTAPHSSALCNSILVAKLTHRTAYRHYFVIGILNTVVLSVIAVLLIQLGITF